MVRYSAGILDWSQHELKAIYVKTSRRLTNFGVLHSLARVCAKRKDGGRGLISVIDWVRKEELYWFMHVKKSVEWVLKVVSETLQDGESKHEHKKRAAK